MSADQTEIFKKLSPSERDDFFSALTREKPELIGKLPDQDQLFRLRPLLLEKGHLRCSAPPEAATALAQGPQNAVISLQLGADRYFLTSPARPRDDGSWELRTEVDVFKLQRRQNFRLQIPMGYPAQLEIRRCKGLDARIQGSLLDFSTGGCRIAIPKDSVAPQLADLVEGVLRIDHRPDIPFRAHVRHVKEDRDRKLVGLEFTDVNPGMEARLFGTVMELHRALYKNRD
ncbi:MAG: PilZ domain-containing protein [Bdellovibrionaceae bacterium]|nr:PilZ domain-containing protein [Pseudobdellovibrionaceae bacterium]